MTIPWKAAEQYLTVVLFGFQFCPVCSFGKFINNYFGLSTVRSERVKILDFDTPSHIPLFNWLQTMYMYVLIYIYSFWASLLLVCN